MSKLLKYELLRRKQLLIGMALSMLFAEGVALFGVYNGGAGNGNGWYILAILMSSLLVIGGMVLAFLDAVTKLYSDFKQKHGYMLFMTPQSGYKVIWAKTIFGVLEIIAVGLVTAACLIVTCTIADNLCGGEISKLLAMIPFNAGFFIGCAGLGLFQLMAQLSIAMLAVTVSRALTRSSSWLIALLMYFGLAMVVNMADSALLVAFGVVGDIMRVANNKAFVDTALFAKYFIIGAVTYSVWFVGCTTLSGRLVNRGIDL